ncbi:hypothetical protein [Solemya velum gill symbiont]|uniref:hypothetical protein n=1 Tax=Solemya velum gill symbiont TaxID=2340 RepID=UPI0009961DB5|nr:hypothetical protein [Solemya velum gill symbiont]OOZ25141.1 hypothetical protein BOW32_11565 [Solemya velum gill symbiont]
MKLNSFLHAMAYCSLVFAFSQQPVFAMTEVYCEFVWPHNEESNVKSSYETHKNIQKIYPALVVKNGRVVVIKSVRTKEYNRLLCNSVGGCSVKARVRGDRGAKCNLAHPENVRIDIDIKKDRLRYNPNGPIPNCGDFNAQVKCFGSMPIR